MNVSWSLFLIVTCSLFLRSTARQGDNALEPDDTFLGAPVIDPSNSEFILQNGQNFTLRCRGNRNVIFKRQHLPEEVVGPFKMEQRTVKSTDTQFEIALDFFFVDKFAVGYYACFDNTLNETMVLGNVAEEPVSTQHVTYTYIYVNGSDSLFAPMREMVLTKSESKVVIECRPTAPDVHVTLTSQSNKLPNYTYSPKIGFVLKLKNKYYSLKCYGERGNQIATKMIQQVASVPDPKIIAKKKFLEGETFVLNCTVIYQKNSAVILSWDKPSEDSKIINETNENEVTQGNLFNAIHVVNATKNDEGTYTCVASNGNDKKTIKHRMLFVDKPFCNIDRFNELLPTRQRRVQILLPFDCYPPVEFQAFKDGKDYSDRLTKTKTGKNSFLIQNATLDDTGNYTVVASNQYLTRNFTFDFKFKAPPKIEFGTNESLKYLLNQQATLKCEVKGFPLPTINWIFTTLDNQTEMGITTIESVYKVSSMLTIPVQRSGNVTCSATNEIGNDSVTRRFLVYELPNGFGIKSNNIADTSFSENQNVVLECLGSIYEFSNVTWENYNVSVEYKTQQFSHQAKLKIDHISLDQAGVYTCVGFATNGTVNKNYVNVTVAELQALTLENAKDEQVDALPYQPIKIHCQASAVPPPTLKWIKDNKILSSSENVAITFNYVNHNRIINSTIEIRQMREEDKGKYECVVTSDDKEKIKTFNIVMKEQISPFIYNSIIAVTVFVGIILGVCTAWRRKKERKLKKQLVAAGLLFKNGVTKSLNPDLGIDEQAELLPYDEKFEFPENKLIMGKQLGAGAFGVVYKAEARGIIDAEQQTTVAVKMVKKTADNMYIKALTSELKIMIHLGKHVNIVNLLGACTKNVGKRELIVIVEYCKFGNIHNYMQKHRGVFIDQLTDNKDKNVGKVNRAFSSSSGNSGMQSDYFGSNHTQETDHTFLTTNTNRSGRKVSESGYVQPEWRSNYESDYSYEGRSPRPLTSRDLLAWAFQIARGMEYLVSRKVLHGDLAARNILLAEDNVVKICDFGLAKSIYNNEEYQKKENSPLPIKWLAIECMTDRIFSTQSDVWSFGIVLWELFSLAKTPYPNVSHMSLLQFLTEGHRLDKPQYADDRIYETMRRCWNQKPIERPSFTELQDILGSFLEDDVRNHYVELNSINMDVNTKKQEAEDYLGMLCAPDYNNMVTPSHHHYVNEGRAFFPATPTQLQQDDEGYLQMSPATNQTLFSSRAQGNKFDFDARKSNPRVSEAGILGSELTPMLTLNNLPARSGSESDHEGSTSPYCNMCPRIEEESDEVFHVAQNNFKNVQNGAVTNLTYIAFDAGQKPNDIPKSNNIYNNVANGLVK